MADVLSGSAVTGTSDPWGAILDQLELCVLQGESGGLDLLTAWAPPVGAPPLPREHAMRASLIAERQSRLMERMRDEQQALSAEMSSLRRPKFRMAEAPPVYIDRSA
ncbi:hypothetical protein [Naasia lichenicola]|uniref:Flagellar protein FliT n=1 Tax=Naasia lichenicola TaxID=2565933 RepID=A0A4V3WSW0_9MICO|nr:hypothetical protein [Naasia lichenicola]THG29667.1 hypothetical protein E6C64_13440 [Naasia lichenicola]